MAGSEPAAGPRLPPLRSVIARHRLAADKRLGQHFLLDLNITRRIARAAVEGFPAGLDGGTTIEIGPGPGGLTRALLDLGSAPVVAVEKDRRCLPALAELDAAWPGRLTVVEGDALALDVRDLGPAPRRIVANLPYNIATPLLFGWLDAWVVAGAGAFDGLLLMLQKEVGDRIVAVPGAEEYGRLSVAVQRVAQCARVLTLPAAAFTPAPKVDSVVMRFLPRRDLPDPARWRALQQVTAAAFGQRRKMLRRALEQLPAPRPPVAAILEAAGVVATARAEELDGAAFDRLAAAFGTMASAARAPA